MMHLFVCSAFSKKKSPEQNKTEETRPRKFNHMQLHQGAVSNHHFVLIRLKSTGQKAIVTLYFDLYGLKFLDKMSQKPYRNLLDMYCHPCLSTYHCHITVHRWSDRW